MNRMVLFLACLSLVPFHSKAQLWSKTFPHRNVPFSDTILQQAVCCWDTARGGLVAYSMDATVRGGVQTHYVRLNKRGDTLWTKRNLFRPNWEEVVSSIIQLPNGDFVLAAMTQDTLGGSHVDGHVIKRIDANGNPLFTGLVTFPKRRGDEHIQVLNGPNGGYYVVSSWWGTTSNSTLGVDSVVGKIILQRYNAANVLLGTVNISNGDIAGYTWSSPICPSFPTPAKPTYFNAIKVLSAAPALDGGFFALFKCDTTLVFSPATCSYQVNAGAVAGGFVCKYNPGLGLVWRTHLTTALNLPADSIFVPQRCIATSDSGLVVMGVVKHNSESGAQTNTVVVKLNNLGVMTKVLRTPKWVIFDDGIESSIRRLMFETRTYLWYGPWIYEWLPAVTQFDRNLNFINYYLLQLDSPGSNHVSKRFSMAPNQYGGAFVPFLKDTTQYGTWRRTLPGAVNIDSTSLAYQALIGGRVVRDQNNNCIEDAGIDRTCTSRLITITDTSRPYHVYYAIPDRAGDWMAPVDLGVVNISHDVPPNKGAECPSRGFRNINLTSTGSSLNYVFYDTLRRRLRDVKGWLH